MNITVMHMNVYFKIVNPPSSIQNKEGEVAAVCSNDLLWFLSYYTYTKVNRLIDNADGLVFAYGFSTKTVLFSLDNFWDQHVISPIPLDRCVKTFGGGQIITAGAADGCLKYLLLDAVAFW